MIVVNRFRVPPDAAAEFRLGLQEVSDLFRASTGCLYCEVGRNVDEPDLWLLQSRWRDVGSYRRGLSAGAVKMVLTPLARWALDEASAYEPVEPGAELNESQARSLP